MPGRTDLDALKRRLQQQGEIGAPLVEQVEPHVRSAGTFTFTDPTTAGTRTDEHQQVQTLIGRGSLLGGIVLEWGYNVPHDRGRQFSRWLLDNEGEITSEQPDGVRYRGTYAAFATSHLSAGEYRTVWSCTSLAGLQTLNDHAADPHSRFGKLIAELTSFRDARPDAGKSQVILVPAALASRL